MDFMHLMRQGFAFVPFLALALMTGSEGRAAISINPYFPTPLFDATPLGNALVSSGTGITLTSSTYSQLGFTPLGLSSTHGLYSVTPGNNYGLTRNGVVLSTGDVGDYISGPNTTAGNQHQYGYLANATNNNLLSPITGNTVHKDVADLNLTFDAGPFTSGLEFDLVFGSEEYPEFVGSQWIDGFGIFLNNQNYALVNGLPVNIKHPAMRFVASTELDGVLAPKGNPVVRVSVPVAPGSTGNSLKFLLADTVDDRRDSTVFISNLQGVTTRTGKLNVSTLASFDIVTPTDREVNDFHIRLDGITDPTVSGEHQIGAIYPDANQNPPILPTGWNPPAVKRQGTGTIISWGPGDDAALGQKLNFGVSLTALGVDALSDICINWTKDGQPIFEGGNPNMPVAVTNDDPEPGQVNILLTSQNCPDFDIASPPRWITDVHVSILDGEVSLADLAAGHPGEGPITEGPIHLPSGGFFQLERVDEHSPVSPGDSIVVSYDVYEDNNGSQGQYLGTARNAFLFSVAVPEPSGLFTAVFSFVCTTSFLTHRRMRREDNPAGAAFHTIGS